MPVRQQERAFQGRAAHALEVRPSEMRAVLDEHSAAHSCKLPAASLPAEQRPSVPTPSLLEADPPPPPSPQ